MSVTSPPNAIGINYRPIKALGLWNHYSFAHTPGGNTKPHFEISVSNLIITEVVISFYIKQQRLLIDPHKLLQTQSCHAHKMKFSTLTPDHNLLEFLNTDLYRRTSYSLLQSPLGVPWNCINTVHYRTPTQIHIQ